MVRRRWFLRWCCAKTKTIVKGKNETEGEEKEKKGKGETEKRTRGLTGGGGPAAGQVGNEEEFLRVGGVHVK